MQLRMIVAAIVGAAAATWAGVLWLGGQTLGAAMLQPYGVVVFAVTMLALAFETILWRLPIVRSWVAKRPPIAGTWRATLVSNYIQPDGSQTVKTVYVVIAQSLTRLSVRMFTDKAHSRSLAERISPSHNDELFELAIVYQNIPNIDQRTAARGGKIHFGALLIPNVPYSAETLNGHYWTDRGTEGSLTLSERRSKLASSYEQAQRLFK